MDKATHEKLDEIQIILSKPVNVPSGLLIVSSASMASLLFVTREMAACNQFGVNMIEHWPDLKPEFDIVVLNKQAERLLDECDDILIFVDGEETEVAEITEKLKLSELNNFLNEVFDGYLHEQIAK